ncbi:PQQ-binding-like beta-propeller repeat protein [Streptomyces sp. NBC_01476]|uniref:PQQ-binding-like beta-propeller repeat protein n=1 Tax=Streptomyces sp. NBC_01476 TaxID=2903881 RepID=UPI002E33D0B6|nr:PQQ-binding-like beta-propeller repeat protein [Streptomyces sp. NBC_01476]
MRIKRVIRLLVVLTVFAFTAVLIPGIRSTPALAAPAAPTGTTASSGADAVTRSAAFDPRRAYVPGTSQPPQTTAGPAAAAGTGGAAGPDANGGSLGLSVTGGVETAQGTPLTSPLSGGDALQVYSLGVVSRVHADGSTVWQRSTASLYRDWHLTFTNPGYVATPQLVVGTDPADPFYVTTGQPFAMGGTQPYAVGDLNGDGAADVAVAETVGVNLGAASCGNCGWPFSVPGSDLHFGTFVTVLDGRTGATLHSELDPGFVTQLAVTGKDLIIGDETGSPTGNGGPGAWGSSTTVRAIVLRGGSGGSGSHGSAGHGAPAATEAWRYATGAQWGRLLGLQPVGGGVAVSWSDTPLGLGVPGPPDGHVVLVDAHGTVRWDRRTAGYPVLTRYDAGRGLLAVVEQTDPATAVSYTLAGLRVTDGRTTTTTRTDGVLPTALAIGVLSPHGRTSWIVSGVVTTPDQVAPPAYSFTASTVSAVDPGTARTQWSHALAAGDGTPVQPATIEVVPTANGQASVVVGSWLSPVTPSPASPIDEAYDLQGLAGGNGAPRWEHAGDVADPATLSTDGTGVRGVTAAQDAVHYDAGTGKAVRTAPLLGDLYAAVSADVDGDHCPDDIAGGQSGAVYAFDGRTLTPADDAPHVLWRADVGGPVHQIVATTVAGRPVLAVAATTGIALVDERTGKVLHRMALPGQYAWNVAVGRIGGRTAVVTATDRVSAFDASTGQALWTYRPAGASYFANAAVTDGVVVAEYQDQVESHQAPTTMSALGIDGGTGRTVWTAPADPATTYAAQLPNGVAAGPGIPGAGADGAAFTWTTSDGQGRVDVRDARTGRLIYSNTDNTLSGHESYFLDPRAGLIATGDTGSAAITPDGPDATFWASGTDSGIAEAGGTPVLLTAHVALNAYPLSVLTAGDDEVDPLAAYEPFQTGRLSVTADNRVLTMPIDWRAHQILVAEAGQTVRAYDVSIQHGLESLTLTGTPAASAAKHRTMAPKAPVTRPDTLPLGDTAAGDARIGTAQPAAAVRVRGYTGTGKPQLTAAAPSGYDPAAVRAYLGLRGTGAGQTVAVVDAPGDAGIVGDVNGFSAQFGLNRVCPGAATAGCFHLTVTAPDGTGPDDPNWGLETAMDVEWIHAVAPQAAVVLVEAHDGGFASLFRAVDAAAALHPDAISMSWGIAEEFTDETYYDQHCRLAGSVCSVASGDYGHPGSYPAYNPAVLSVGGTTLDLGGDGAVTGETAWAGSGGGRSYVEPTPGYQKGVVSGGRGTPDVSFDADPATGVAVYDTAGPNGESGWYQVGGTSLGAPSWAAILASADQLRAAAGKPRLTSADGSAQKAVYAAAGRLGDIVSGPANGFCPSICSATTGYDFVTGLGSPRAGLDATLAAAP